LEFSDPRLRRQSWLGLSDWTLPPLRENHPGARCFGAWRRARETVLL